MKQYLIQNLNSRANKLKHNEGEIDNIEGHHNRPVLEMSIGEETKVEDIKQWFVRIVIECCIEEDHG